LKGSKSPVISSFSESPERLGSCDANGKIGILQGLGKTFDAAGILDITKGIRCETSHHFILVL
jgi:hypothetical protein